MSEDDLVKQTLIETNLSTLRPMLELWGKHVGTGTQVHYWLTKTIEELESLRG
jgi:hypothetical protein